jgi:hypothetical protein
LDLWIIPKTLSAFVPDMVGLSLDFDSLASILERSAMWRSKHSLKRTWFARLKKAKWMRHLSGRILKPSLHNDFLEKYTASLADIPASHLVTPGSEKEQKILDTFGRIYSNTSVQLDLFGASSKTSQDTSHLDLMRFSRAFEIWVTKLRQDCLQRQRSGHHTKESDYLSWPTVTKSDTELINGKFKRRSETTGEVYGSKLQDVAVNWETPTVSTGGHSQKDGTRVPKLDQQVKRWPTPTVPGPHQVGKIEEWGGSKNKLRNSRPDPDKNNTTSKNRGQLNPAWVEQLMGLEAGWTNFDCWVTE